MWENLIISLTTLVIAIYIWSEFAIVLNIGDYVGAAHCKFDVIKTTLIRSVGVIRSKKRVAAEPAIGTSPARRRRLAAAQPQQRRRTPRRAKLQVYFSFLCFHLATFNSVVQSTVVDKQ